MSQKRVLITGAGGFIGSHLVERVVKAGYKVRAFVHYNSNNLVGWLNTLDCKSDLEIVAEDIRDYDSVSAATQNIDSVFHLGALIGIPYSYVSPLAYLKTNVEGTYNVLQSALKHGTQSVVVTSTSETYGSAQSVPMNEQHRLNAQSPYAASKIGADQLSLSYHRSFGLPVKIVRPFNTFGPRQSARAIIPTIVSQILAGNSKIKLGNLTPTRDLTFVKDTVEGFWAIEQSDKFFGEVVHVSMNEEISVEQLALKIAELMGKKIELETVGLRSRPENSEVDRLFGDNSKLKSLTSWKASYTLESGLDETIRWLRSNEQGYRTEQYCV